MATSRRLRVRVTSEQPSLHIVQVVSASSSGEPYHRAYRSVSVPVGQMSMQAPQNVQPDVT
ncbi:MAG: hypothetical protein HY815_11200 [Candidatus Riflebacteria bacterium]|nr:hypothetical protein [Candidatus Riflebacteria bacterium]